MKRIALVAVWGALLVGCAGEAASTDEAEPESVGSEESALLGTCPVNSQANNPRYGYVLTAKNAFGGVPYPTLTIRFDYQTASGAMSSWSAKVGTAPRAQSEASTTIWGGPSGLSRVTKITVTGPGGYLTNVDPIRFGAYFLTGCKATASSLLR